ncbi:hypothetical protein EXE63_01255 (plasmid) [Mycolicibacterium frederiksbergense]|uniref:Uncharacterized protein n=1 Tax=Mycolicibacterium frederiksbergense TaxID=117567 RepID=A0A6H0S046_9MYCO|nr:hypothetical protein EXE63_01255 [Mycolicibacterium frederiksbergense]
MSSAEFRFRPAIRFIVPSRPTWGHRTLKLVGLIQREHATGSESTVLVALRGNSGSGKSTIARMLRERHGLPT